jgi:diguanylate cyclase (GGDEF)-like protein
VSAAGPINVTVPAALRRLLRSDVLDEQSQRGTDPRAGSRVAVVFPAAALTIVLVWLASSTITAAPFLSLSPEEIVLFTALAAFYGRFPVELGPRTVFTFETPMLVLAGLLGGPLAGSLVGAVGGASDQDFVLRRNAAYGGLGACSGAVAGFVGLAWQQGQLDVEVAAALAVAAVLGTSFLGRLLVQVDRRLPKIALFSRDDGVELVEAVLMTPVLALLAASYGERPLLALVVVCSGGVAVMLMTRALAAQRLATERERRALLRDRLTGAASRAAFEDALEREWHCVLRGAHPAGVLMIDVDHFKEVNDTHRHAGGDRVLRQLVERLSETGRGQDLLGRWGGEELCFLAPGIGSLTDLETVAERLRNIVSESAFVLPAGEVGVTVSIGGTLLDGSLPPGAVLERADEALYVAKRRRDAVCVLPPSEPSVTPADARMLAFSS